MEPFSSQCEAWKEVMNAIDPSIELEVCWTPDTGMTIIATDLTQIDKNQPRLLQLGKDNRTMWGITSLTKGNNNPVDGCNEIYRIVQMRRSSATQTNSNRGSR